MLIIHDRLQRGKAKQAFGVVIKIEGMLLLHENNQLKVVRADHQFARAAHQFTRFYKKLKRIKTQIPKN